MWFRARYTVVECEIRVQMIFPRKNVTIASTAIATVTKMMESVPEPAQDQMVAHLREYLAELQDEGQWDTLFKKTQPQLIAAARRARQEIDQGHAKPMESESM